MAFTGNSNLGRAVATAIAVLACTAVSAQQLKTYTTAEYAQAERFMPYNLNPLATKGVVRPHWMADGRFWYRSVENAEISYRLVDPRNKLATNIFAFDQERLAAALSIASGKKNFDAARLVISELAFYDHDKGVRLRIEQERYDCRLGDRANAPDVCTADRLSQAHEPLTLSPDGRRGAFVRGYNLWVRDLAAGTETQLTADGVKDFGYATDNAGWKQSDGAVVLWSPDSRKIATYQQDQRKVGEMYLVPLTNGHPQLKTWKYPLVGDENVTLIERVIVEVSSKKLVRLKMTPDQHRSTICDDVACEGIHWDDVEWSPDARHLAFVSTSRDHKQEWLRIADTATGEVREVYTETVPKFFESGADKVNWHYLPDSNEFLWFSERDGWGQLYLYDLTTGRLKNPITHGEGNVTQVLRVDERSRTIFYLAVGKEQGRDPYFQHLYSIRFDGTGVQLLTPENANHEVSFSGDGRYFVDIASTPETPASTLLRGSAKGDVMMDLGRQDLSKLTGAGWVPPTPITVKARDGRTDLYGLMYKPTSFDTAKRYPIINRVYPGPQTGSCGDRSFTAARGDMQALAELGFIVVCIDGMGTPFRSKRFHEAYYGDLGDNTIPDQIAGMKELAARYAWIDLDRAGIYGHSGGGNATAAAMFHYPEFFKVGIAESGNHDQRDYEDDWAEKWTGLEVKNPDGSSNYDSQANQNFAKNLKGHLLLAHGTMDDNVPPSNTMLVVDALIKANKDFDLLMIPDARHGYRQASQYMTRRRWDYFVRYLSGATPPAEYQMKSFTEVNAALDAGPVDDDEE